MRDRKKSGKLKVKVIGRKLYLPKELIRKAALPENGVCERSELAERSPKDLNIARILTKKAVTVPISNMARAEEVEDV